MIEVMFNTNGVRTSLHDSNSLTSFAEEVNAISKLECKVYATDESYNNIFPEITDVQAYDTHTNEVIFEGSVYSAKPTQDADGSIYIDVTCLHILNRLTTAWVIGFDDSGISIGEAVRRILDIYNETAKSEHEILLGKYPNGSALGGAIKISNATCFDAIYNIITDKEWEFTTRYADGNWYLDISEDFGTYASSSIITGVNMVSISKTVDSSDLYTRIIPIGGASYIKYPDPRMHGMPSEPEGMPLTLYNYHKDDPYRIYIANEDLEKKYPVKAKVIQYDDVIATDATDFDEAQNTLYEKGKDDADKLVDIVEAYEVTALDLSRAGYDFDKFELNKMYRIVNNRLNVDATLKVTSRKINYQNPLESDLTFGPINKKAMSRVSRDKKTSQQRLNDLGSTAYVTTNTRMGGTSIRNTSSAQYSSMPSHDPNTLYVVSEGAAIRTLAATPVASPTKKVDLYFGDIKISGGGGSTNIASAALLNDDNFSSFVIKKELMMDIDAHTHLYYGDVPAFIIIQGQYCLYDSTDAQDFPNKTELLERVYENRDLFGAEVKFDAAHGNAFYGYPSSVNSRWEISAKITAKFRAPALLPTGMDICPPLSLWEEGFINSSGVIAPTEPDYYEIVSDYIEIDQSKTYTFATEVPSGRQWMAYGLYDESHRFLTRVSAYDILTMDIDPRQEPDAKYIRLCFAAHRNPNVAASLEVNAYFANAVTTTIVITKKYYDYATSEPSVYAYTHTVTDSVGVSDVIIVPRIRVLSGEKTFGREDVPTPYGYATGTSDAWLLVRYYDNKLLCVRANLSDTLANGTPLIDTSMSNWQYNAIPVLNEAEEAFNAGVSARSELIVDEEDS